MSTFAFANLEIHDNPFELRIEYNDNIAIPDVTWALRRLKSPTTLGNPLVISGLFP